MNSLPGLLFLPHQAGTPSSQWVHTRNLTQPAALLGGRELQPEEMTEDRGWVKQMWTCNTGFCTSHEPPCGTSGRDGNQTAQRQIALSFSDIQRSASGNSPPTGFPPSVPGKSPVLWGENGGAHLITIFDLRGGGAWTRASAPPGNSLKMQNLNRLPQTH